MKKNKLLGLACIGIFILVACSKQQQQLDAAGYIKWTEDPASGLANIKEIGNFEFALLYKPVDYIISKETLDKNISKDSILKRMSELKGYQYYTLRIKSLKDNEFLRTGLTSENEYYERLEYFVSHAQDDISLVEGKDTLPCTVYHFERNYGISPYNNIVLSFEEKDTLTTDDRYFIYDDKILGVGKIVIKIEASTLKELPKLNL